MPSAAGSTVLPIRRETKSRLDDAKGDATYDETLRTLLRLAPPERIRRARETLRGPPVEERAPRTPAKQKLVAELAAEAWRIWEREGRARFAAPRVIAWRFARPGPRLGVTLLDRRGFPDAESP